MAASRDTELDLSLTLGDSSFSGSGKSDIVMRALDRFLEVVGDGDAAEPVETPKPSKPPAKRQTRTRGTKAVTAKEDSTTPVKVIKEPLPVLLGKLDLKANKRIGTAVVAWAEVNEGKSTFTVAEILTYWRRTQAKPPKNLNRDLEDAFKAGWLDKNPEGYSINGFGKAEVGIS